MKEKRVQKRKKIFWGPTNVSFYSNKRVFAHLYLCVHYVFVFHGTAHSCCMDHQSAAVFIGWWPQNANSCITQGQGWKSETERIGEPDVFNAHLPVLKITVEPLKSCANYVTARISNSIWLAHQKQRQQERLMGYVHCSTGDEMSVSNKTFFKSKCHCLEWYIWWRPLILNGDFIMK